jgi:hypothetical protein
LLGGGGRGDAQGEVVVGLKGHELLTRRYVDGL